MGVHTLSPSPTHPGALRKSVMAMIRISLIANRMTMAISPCRSAEGREVDGGEGGGASGRQANNHGNMAGSSR